MEVVRRRTEGRKADVYHNSYLFLKMKYSAVVKVYKVVRCDANDDRTVIDAGYIGMYNRYDKVPKEVWSAHVYTVGAEAEDVLSVMIEDEK